MAHDDALAEAKVKTVAGFIGTTSLIVLFAIGSGWWASSGIAIFLNVIFWFPLGFILLLNRASARSDRRFLNRPASTAPQPEPWVPYWTCEPVDVEAYDRKVDTQKHMMRDCVSVLVTMGDSKTEAQQKVHQAICRKPDLMTIDALLREAMK